jgi:hypothetical protein
MPEKVLDMFPHISVKGDKVIMVLLFNACAKHVNEQSKTLGKETLRRLNTDFLRHQNLINAALDMLLKFGDINDAEHFFQSAKTTNEETCGMMMQGSLIFR